MLLANNEQKLNKKMLSQVFFSGCKISENIGVESEKLLVYKNSSRAVSYSDIVKILNSFDEENWQRVYESGNLIGLKGKVGNITLEPGSQIEISLKPFKTIDEIVKNLSDFYNDLSVYAQKISAIVLDKGIQPVSTYENIKVIPKKRYEFMTKYLPLKGLEPFIMMRETAGIQANFDYKSEDDAIEKLSLALKMSPIISTMYANSSVRKGRLTEIKSNRANSWLKVDENRCGYISKKLIEKPRDFKFEDYVEILLNVPMIFVERNGEYFGTTQTFREFMLEGLYGIQANMNDWETHISLYFPDVRLKSYVEIRNHDAQNSALTCSVPTFWKGIIYNEDARNEINSVLSKYEYEDYLRLRKDSIVQGINSKLGRFKIIELVKEFFDISYSSLKENKQGEEKYLECVYELISLKKVPADIE